MSAKQSYNHFHASMHQKVSSEETWRKFQNLTKQVIHMEAETLYCKERNLVTVTQSKHCLNEFHLF